MDILRHSVFDCFYNIDTLVKPIMTYNSEVTYLDTFISLYRAKKRASTNDKEVDLFNFIDKT
jgi:hypothetical protein